MDEREEECADGGMGAGCGRGRRTEWGEGGRGVRIWRGGRSRWRGGGRVWGGPVWGGYGFLGVFVFGSWFNELYDLVRRVERGRETDETEELVLVMD